MHHKEYFRTTNTSHLLNLVAPSHTKRYIAGVPEDERALSEEIRQHAPHVMILYPNQTAVTTKQIISKFSSENSTNTLPPLRIIVLDGTWSTGAMLLRRLRKAISELHLPHEVPIVKLNPPNESLFHKTGLRPEELPSHTSTLEAMIVLLEELGEDRESVCRPLWDVTKIAVAAAAKQKPPPGESKKKQSKRQKTESIALCDGGANALS